MTWKTNIVCAVTVVFLSFGGLNYVCLRNLDKFSEVVNRPTTNFCLSCSFVFFFGCAFRMENYGCHKIVWWAKNTEEYL